MELRIQQKNIIAARKKWFFGTLVFCCTVISVYYFIPPAGFVRLASAETTSTSSYVPSGAAAALAQTMKDRGCILSGLLGSELWFPAAHFDEYVAMLGRTDCKYIHRAIETWISPPDFQKISERIQSIRQRTGKDYIYEIMIAEAVKTDAVYHYPDENRNFNFAAMCRDAVVDNFWGPNTCRPSFYEEEYRKYLRHITRSAIDAGIQSIMFGEIGHQDGLWWQEPPPAFSAPAIVKGIRDYAASRGRTVVIVAQAGGSRLTPGEARSQTYARHFDFLLGALGLEAGISRFDECLDSESPTCKWAGNQWFAFGKPFRELGHNTLVMLDWENTVNDDSRIFARLSAQERADLLYNVYTKLKARGAGFIMPLMQGLGGPALTTECYGSDPATYSADKTQTHERACRDEDAIQAAFRGIRWTVDTQPPRISNAQITSLGTSSVTVSWTTSEPTTSRIEFGRRGESARRTVGSSTLRTYHVFGIAGIQNGVTFNFSVSGSDAAGNSATPEIRSFTRMSDPGTPLEWPPASPSLPSDSPPSPPPAPPPAPAPLPSSPSPPPSTDGSGTAGLGYIAVLLIFLGLWSLLWRRLGG